MNSLPGLYARAVLVKVTRLFYYSHFCMDITIRFHKIDQTKLLKAPLQSLHEGSLETTCTVPLNAIYSLDFIHYIYLIYV